MKLVCFALFLSLSVHTLYSQATVISGKVHDARKQTIAGASVSLRDSYDGTTTDSIGKFRFLSSASGTQTLTITYMGFKNWEQSVTLTGTPISIEVVLKEEPNELTAVVITAGSFEASDQKKTTVLKPLDIVTTASANADVAAAMKTLPGTQQIGESGELFVRGGEGNETRQFIDATTVANPFFSQAPNIASRGRFSPFLFKGTVFSTGGYSALYGQALSSALILESIDLPERSAASASLSPLFAGAQYQYLDSAKRYSWGASAGYTNVALYFRMVPQRPDYFHAPELFNGDANFRIKTSQTGMLKFYASFAGNALGLRNPDIDMPELKNAFQLNNTNIYSNLSYRERLSNRLKINAGLGFSQNIDDLSQELQDAGNQPVNSNLPPYMEAKNYSVLSKGTMLQARVVFDYKLKGLSALRGGAEYWYSADSSRYNQFKFLLQDHYGAAFGEADIYLTNALAARAGVRIEYSDLLRRTNVSPRASLAYKLAGGAQISADYGVFYQKPLNQYLLYNTSLPQMRADHYIITWQRVGLNRVFRTQLFHKEYKQLMKFAGDTSTSGYGYARGLEFFWRDKRSFKNFDYWITYSFLETKRDYLNFPFEMTPNFAARHTANLVVKRFFTKLNLQVNANYQFATGRPYYNIRFNNAAGKWDVQDQGKTISYNNLSLSLNYLTSIGKAFGVLVFSMTNVLNSTQVFGYTYSYDGNNKVATVPPANRFVFLGLFLSWGTDRRQDAINNNL